MVIWLAAVVKKQTQLHPDDDAAAPEWASRVMEEELVAVTTKFPGACGGHLPKIPSGK